MCIIGNFYVTHPWGNFLKFSLVSIKCDPPETNKLVFGKSNTKFILTIKTDSLDKGIGLCLGASGNSLAKSRNLSPSQAPVGSMLN